MGRLDRLWTSNKHNEVISFCNVLLTKNPTDLFAFYYRGLSNEKLNLLDESLEDFKQAETILTNYKRTALIKDYFTKIPVQMSRVYKKLQNTEKAFEYADKAVQADKSEIDGLKWRAFLKEDLGDLIGASEDINEAMRRRPKDKVIVKMRDRLTYFIIQDKKETANR